MADRETPAGLAGLVAVVLGVCCGIPLLVSAGALRTVAGMGLRNWSLIALRAVVVAAVAAQRLCRLRGRSSIESFTVETGNR